MGFREAGSQAGVCGRGWLGTCGPVVVHVADEQRIEGIQVPAQHRELISHQELTLFGFCLRFQAQLLFLSHYLTCPLAQSPNGRDEVCVQELWAGPAHNGLGKHYRSKWGTLTAG